jgi:hypothetical protein
MEEREERKKEKKKETKIKRQYKGKYFFNLCLFFFFWVIIFGLGRFLLKKTKPVFLKQKTTTGSGLAQFDSVFF